MNKVWKNGKIEIKKLMKNKRIKIKLEKWKYVYKMKISLERKKLNWKLKLKKIENEIIVKESKGKKRKLENIKLK